MRSFVHNLLKPFSFIAIDIGSDSIKIMQMTQIKQRIQYEAICDRALPCGAISADRIQNMAVIQATIQSMLQKMPLKSKQVILSVPDPLVTLQLIEFDSAMNETEIAVQISLESDRYLRDNIDSVNWDFCILNSDNSVSNTWQVLLAVVKKSVIEERICLSHALGLQLKAIDLEACAIERAVHRCFNAAKTSVFAVVTLDQSRVVLRIFERGRLFFFHQIFLNANRSSAELEHAIQSILAHYRKGYPKINFQHTIKKIFLIGSLAKSELACIAISKACDLACVIVDPQQLPLNK